MGRGGAWAAPQAVQGPAPWGHASASPGWPRVLRSSLTPLLSLSGTRSTGLSRACTCLQHLCRLQGCSDGAGQRMPGSVRGSHHPRVSHEQEDSGHQAQPWVQAQWLPGQCSCSRGLALLQETPPWGFIPPECPESKFSSPGAQKSWSSVSDWPHRDSAYLWVFRTSVPPPPSPVSSRLPSSVSPSTLWPPLPRLPGIPLIGSCRPGLPPPPAPGLC